MLALADALEANDHDSGTVVRFQELARRYLDRDGPRAAIVRGWLAAISGDHPELVWQPAASPDGQVDTGGPPPVPPASLDTQY